MLVSKASLGMQIASFFKLLPVSFRKWTAKIKDGIVTLDEFLESCQEVERRDPRAQNL